MGSKDWEGAAASEPISEGVSKWGNICSTQNTREWRKGDTDPTAWVCSIQAKISCQKHKQSPRDFSQRCLEGAHSSCSPTALGFFHCHGSCSYTEFLIMFLPQATASPAHTSQWTKRCLEASSEAVGMHYKERQVRRWNGNRKKRLWAMPSLLSTSSLYGRLLSA